MDPQEFVNQHPPQVSAEELAERRRRLALLIPPKGGESRREPPPMQKLGPNPAFLAKLEQSRKQREREAEVKRAELEAKRAAFLGDCVYCFDDPIPCRHCARGVRLAQEIAERDRLARLFGLYERAGVPPAFRVMSLEHYPGSPEALAKVKGWLTTWNEKDWLTLYGKYGVGKSGLAAGIVTHLAHDWAEQRRSMRWTTSAEYLHNLRPNDNDGVRSLRLRDYQHPELLVLDDLGAERLTDWGEEQLYVLIDYRHAHQLATIITSNYDQQALKDRLGDRIFWRIHERGKFLRVEGPNLREAR